MSKALALDRRQAPEFYAVGSEVSAGAHAEAIRFALGELGLSAVSCINGVPTIGFLSDPLASIERIDEPHRILWNQGLMSMLLVIRGDELTAYSLVQRPLYREENRGKDARLVKTLSLLADALTLRELLDATQSGRFWYENDGYFNPDNRVDSVLLANLLMAFRSLKDELGTNAAQALLMQTMFVAYLEDRDHLVAEYGLSPYDARVLATSLEFANYYEATVAAAGKANAKICANWVMVDLTARLHRDDGDIGKSPVSAEQLGALIARIGDGTLSNNLAKKVFDAIWNGEGDSADEIIARDGLQQITDTGALERLIDEIITANTTMVAECRAGKEKAFNALIGQAMKATRGKANPQRISELLRRKIG